MVTIRIGNETKDFADASEDWVTQQINRRQRDGQDVCVELRIKTGGLDMAVSTPGCGSGGFGGRPPNASEQEVFDLWRKLVLTGRLSGGNVVAFLKQLRRKLP
jgi:hypothetical protein